MLASAGVGFRGPVNVDTSQKDGSEGLLLSIENADIVLEGNSASSGTFLLISVFCVMLTLFCLSVLQGGSVLPETDTIESIGTGVVVPVSTVSNMVSTASDLFASFSGLNETIQLDHLDPLSSGTFLLISVFFVVC